MLILNDLVILSQLINTKSENNKNIHCSSDVKDDDFQYILKNILSGKIDNYVHLSSKISLDKNQLLTLSHALQIQMNSRFYNSVLNNVLESNALAMKVIRNYENKLEYDVINANSKGSQAMLSKGFPTIDENLSEIIEQAALQYQIDPDLIRSVIHAESNFNPSATSGRGAMGLMQLMPETARDLGIQNAYDLRENIMGGTRYLKMLLTRYDGQVDLALAAYNWGMGNLEKNPDRLPRETISYIDKVNDYYRSMKT